MAWRTDSYGSNESHLAEITAQILSNSGEAGLLDTNVNQQQKALRAVAYNSPLKTYGYFTMVIVPKEGQSMQDAKQLLLQQIDLIKKRRISGLDDSCNYRRYEAFQNETTGNSGRTCNQPL